MSGFTNLVFSRGFEAVSVQDVARTSGVARSTFYEHFSSKEDVLRACMTRFFSCLADCVAADSIPPELVRALDHLWANRRLTDAIFSGRARVVLVRNQVDLVQSRLSSIAAGSATKLPVRLAATQIAEGQMAVTEAWLRGHAFCTSADLANGLHEMSRASALALLDKA